MSKKKHSKENKEKVLSSIKETVDKLHGEGVNVEGLYYGLKNTGNEILDKVVPIDERFVKLFSEQSKVTDEILDNSCLGFLHRLLKYIEYKTNRLVVGSGPGRRTMTRSDIDYIAKAQKATVTKYLQELDKHNIIVVKKEGRKNIYYVNPIVASKGEDVEEETINLFARECTGFQKD